jgi:hypothetical protein
VNIFYLRPAELEYEQKLARIALRPFTTHSVVDFIEDIQTRKNEIRTHPGLRAVPGAPPGYFRAGPSRLHSYSLIYPAAEGNAYVIAVAAPQRRPLYWKGRTI